MRRFFAIILLLTAGAFLLLPGMTYASSYPTLDPMFDPTQFTAVYNNAGEHQGEIAAKVYYIQIDGTVYYQVENCYFDPAGDNGPDDPADAIGSLFLMLPWDINPLDYLFDTENAADVFVDTAFQEFGSVEFRYTPGIAEGMYSGVFTATSIYVIGEYDTVDATFVDGGESINEEVSFALTMGDGSPGTPIPEPLTVDIKPGSDPNSINPKSKGKIPVAILSTMDFYAPAEVDVESLSFGVTGDEESLAFCNESREDVNDDGYDDLVCHFYTQETGFQCGNEEGILKGQTVDEVPIEGRDSVRIVPSACKDEAKAGKGKEK